MTLLYPWALGFLILPLIWVVMAWRSAPRRTLLILKALSLAAIIVALAQPALRFDDRNVAVAVLADTSGSLTPQDLESATNTVRAIERRRGSNFVKVLPFARTTRPLKPSELTGTLAYSEGEAGAATNLEAAIRDGIIVFTGGVRPSRRSHFGWE